MVNIETCLYLIDTLYESANIPRCFVIRGVSQGSVTPPSGPWQEFQRTLDLSKTCQQLQSGELHILKSNQLELYRITPELSKQSRCYPIPLKYTWMNGFVVRFFAYIWLEAVNH